jgi:hypothetical protein
MSIGTADRPPMRYYQGPMALVLVGTIAAAGVVLQFLRDVPPPSPRIVALLIAATVVCFGGAAALYLTYRRFGGTIELLADHVVVQGRAIPLDAVDALTIIDRERPVDAIVFRTVRIGPHRMQYVFDIDDDPLEDVLGELIERLAKRPRIEGDGWTLEGPMLRTRGGRTIAAATASIGVFDRRLRVWDGAERVASFSIPKSSRNALVLAHALSAHALQRPPARDDLGRLLFTRHPSRFEEVVKAVVFVPLALATAWAVIHRFAPELTEVARWLIVVVMLLALLRAAWNAAIRYEIHDGGIRRVTPLGGERTLLTRDVQRMRWREVRKFIKGAYSGTSLRATLHGDDGQPPLKLRMRTFRAADHNMHAVRERVARAVAERLRRELMATGRVPWTSRMHLTATGLELKLGVSSSQVEHIPYDQPFGMMLNDGYLIFYRQSWRDPAAVINSSEENFFPGFELYEERRAK